MHKEQQKIHSEVISPALLVIIVVTVSCMLIANILANRMLQLGIWVGDAGILTFPITYVISDIVSEVYGYKWSRRVSIMSASINFISAVLIMTAMSLPSPDWFDATHFSLALNGSFRIVLASLISYVIGDWVDDVIFEKLRNKQIKSGFKTRAIISSVGGSMVDTTLFIVVAFSFTMPHSEILPMILLGVIAKTAYEILILPVTSSILKVVTKYELKYRQDGVN